MGQQFLYRIERSNRKSTSLRIERDGSVVVRAPYRVDDARIADFVTRHEQWVYSKLRSRKEFALNLSDGEEITLFGSHYKISTGKPHLDETCIYLPQEQREEAFVKLLKKFSLEVLGILTDEIARTHGLCYQAVRISSARSRWGSCNRQGVIAYSFRLAFLPPQLCEYVVVHELCHTKQMNHGKLFWNEVENILPQAKHRRRQLKQYSAIMDCL